MTNKSYLKVLSKNFGFKKFRQMQEQAVKSIIEDKRDVYLTMFTGGGKSLCYQFPAVYTGKTSIVISPLISLMNDQTMKLEELGIKSVAINSTTTDRHKVIEKLMNGYYSVVYTTPETVISLEKIIKTMTKNDKLVTVAIDESHCVSSWGHDFRNVYMKLGKIRNWTKSIPMITLTATATKHVEEDIIKSLSLKDPVILKTTYDRPNLSITLKHKGKNISDDLFELIKSNKPTIIYSPTKKGTENIKNELELKGIKIGIYHAGMSSKNREKIHKKFVSGKLKCITATVAFGMGIDTTIRQVIHYGIPKDMESYYQEMGRAGRDGKPSDCYLFYSLSDLDTVNFFISRLTNPVYRSRRFEMANIMKKYIYSTECRKRYILNYFGERYREPICRNCDNCNDIHKSEVRDMSKPVRDMLVTAIATGEKFGTTMLINVLRGSRAKTIPYAFRRLITFGKGTSQSAKWWKTLSRLILDIEYLEEHPMSSGNGSWYSVSDKGISWLEGYESKDKNTRDAYKLMLAIPTDMLSEKSKKTRSVNTLAETLKLYQEGKSIKDIAKIRSMSNNTIEDHIVKLYKNKSLKMNELVGVGFGEKFYKVVHLKVKKALKKYDRLGEVKRNVPGMTYLQLKLVRAKLES